ncbi:MAG: glutaredoxin 3 [Candidatus Puniceispirillaceae bacterium]
MTSPQIDIYTDMLCSYCALAKRLLKSKQVDFNEIEVSGDANLRAEMRSRANGQRTVPQIFIDDIHIGGYDELYLLDKKGLLYKLLAGRSE